MVRKKNDIEIYSTLNEGKSVVVERFIGPLKSKIYKYMASISKNVCIDKLDEIVDKYSNTYHRTITRMLLVILKVKKLLERFTKKNCKKQIKESLELKK